MFCQRCGTQNQENANFCSKCGQKMNDLQTPVQYSTPYPYQPQYQYPPQSQPPGYPPYYQQEMALLQQQAAAKDAATNALVYGIYVFLRLACFSELLQLCKAIKRINSVM